MSLNSKQVKFSISEFLAATLQSRAELVGLPLTQYIKFILIKEAEQSSLPIHFSDETINKKSFALKQIIRASLRDDINSVFRKQDKDVIF